MILPNSVTLFVHDSARGCHQARTFVTAGISDRFQTWRMTGVGKGVGQATFAIADKTPDNA